MVSGNTVKPLEKVKERLDRVGPGFCLAKWNQVSIHLGRGLTHSCYHPQAHLIPMAEIQKNPAALHNTEEKIRVRKQMLCGERPKECDFCWEIEDRLKGCWSDRVTKSSEDWAWPTLSRVLDSKGGETYEPTYVELSFSNRCNFKCLYCNPDFSSTWQQEAKIYGKLDLPGGVVVDIPIGPEEEKMCVDVENNEYVKAFWKWWPELFPKLKVFRLTGGDPLLVPETYRVLDYIREHWEENPNLILAINTNLGISDKQFERMLAAFLDLGKNRKVKELQIYTSIESAGKQAEYVRWGLKEDLFWSRVEKILSELPKVSLHIMSTYNILCVDSFEEVLRRVFDLKKRYNRSGPEGTVTLSLGIFHLLFPGFMTAKLCNKNQLSKLERCKELLESFPKVKNPWEKGFTEAEIECFSRIYAFVYDIPSGFEREQLMRQLQIFLAEMDLRRDTNFREVFPDFTFNTYE